MPALCFGLPHDRLAYRFWGCLSICCSHYCFSSIVECHHRFAQLLWDTICSQCAFKGWPREGIKGLLEVDESYYIRFSCFVWQSSIRCRSASTCCVVDLSGWKLFWLCWRCESRVLRILLRTRLYSFAGVDIRVMPLLLVCMDRSPFFGVGTKALRCHSWGIVPDTYTALSTSSSSSCSSGDSAVT